MKKTKSSSNFVKLAAFTIPMAIWGMEIGFVLAHVKPVICFWLSQETVIRTIELDRLLFWVLGGLAVSIIVTITFLSQYDFRRDWLETFNNKWKMHTSEGPRVEFAEMLYGMIIGGLVGPIVLIFLVMAMSFFVSFFGPFAIIIFMIFSLGVIGFGFGFWLVNEVSHKRPSSISRYWLLKYLTLPVVALGIAEMQMLLFFSLGSFTDYDNPLSMIRGIVPFYLPLLCAFAAGVTASIWWELRQEQRGKSEAP